MLADHQKRVTMWLYVAAVLGMPVIGVTLWAWGQPLVSASGEIKLWVNTIWSSENSQQIADWYSLSHAIHGMLIALLGRLVVRWTGYPLILAIAIGTGVGWEILEHTDWVLDRFREETLYQGYLGDTVLNAVSDYVFMMSGFFLGWAVPVGWTLALIVALEILAATLGRDCLTLTTLQLIFDLDAVEAWQQELNTTAPPD